jgi:GMP synthase-like glutamine amidotransferase
MRLHCLQHVPFEGLAYIGDWANQKGHAVTTTRLYANDPFPSLDDFDWLIIMGGPMNIYEEERYPWLKTEKTIIRRVLQSEKIILGVCLGGQLIADALGGPVTRNPQREIGWFPITLTPSAADSTVFRDLSAELLVFHWHGDTFAIPPGAKHIASSVACANQAFIYDQRVVGLQFHMDTRPEEAQALIAHCADEIEPGPYMQTPEQILEDATRFQQANGYLRKILEQLETVG